MNSNRDLHDTSPIELSIYLQLKIDTTMQTRLKEISAIK